MFNMEIFKLFGMIAFPMIILPCSEGVQYIGCFKDLFIFRTMHLDANVVPSVEYCIDVCRTKKERYAGLQFGKQCFCGDNYKKYGHSYSCNMKCKSSQICGGWLANSVYKIDTENKECGNAVADIMFVLDDSGSISASQFLLMKHFVKSIVSTFPISSNDVQVGIITFSTGVKNQFNMNKYRNILDLHTAIDRIRQTRGWTHTYAALNYVRNVSFSIAAGDRKDVLNIAVVITDGNSNNHLLTAKAAENLKKNGTVIFAIGVGKKFSDTELKAIGSEPSSKHVFSVNNFGALQSITSSFSTKACKSLQPCTCKASGDPHYRTFDGQMVHFMGTCKYTLATIKNGSNNTYFSVEVKNEHRGNNRVSYTRLVDVKLTGVTIRLLPANKILINSEEKSLPVTDYIEFSATYSVGWITVVTKWGLKVMFDGRHQVTVTLPPTFADQLTGICGDCNGQQDDFRTKFGEDVSKKRNKFSLIGGSYQVPDDSDTPETKCIANDIDLNCSSEQTKGCDLIKNEIFDVCIQKIGVLRQAVYLDSCRIDVCSYHNDVKNRHSVFCRIIEGFVSECEMLGILVNWREKAKCPMKCNTNEEFRYKTGKCQPSCTNRTPNCTGYSQGCVCKEGFILSGEQCVHESECGCIENKIYMKVNEEIISTDCKTKKMCKPGNKIVRQNIVPCSENSYCQLQRGKYACVCKKNFILHNRKCVDSDPCHGEPCKNGATCRKDGRDFQCICTAGFGGKICSESLKPCVCKASGDPHYRTFDGQMIHFMGTCKYILATIKNGSNNTYFSVEVKNEHRGNNDVSYTRLVDVKLTGVTIRLLPANKILVNSEQRTLPIENYKSFTATYSVGWITVITNWGLKVIFDGRHQVTVTLPPTFVDQLTGICGDCNGQRDDFLTKSGEDVSMKRDKFSLIGGSYQVPDDSDTPETKCDVKDIQISCSHSQTQPCNLIRHKLFKSCNQIMGDDWINKYVEACRIDVCSYLKNNHNELNEVRCRILEGFVSECENVGVFVNWRPLAQCAKKCAVNQFYKHKTLTCQLSCSNRSPNCSTYTEGCVCKPGFLLSGGDCVPESECGCYSKNIYMKVYEEIYSDDCRTKSLCHVNGEIEQVKLNGCPSGSQCKVQAYKRICICKDGFSYSNNICRPIDPCHGEPCKNGATCREDGRDFQCICTSGFGGKTCSESLKPCICKASGDPHYRTFDGQMIHFMGTCKYILATIKNGSNNTYFSVEVKNEHRGNNHVSYTRLVDVKLTGVTIRLLPANKILVNSEERTLPIENYKSFIATYSVGWITVITNWGLKVIFDGRHQVTVTLPPTFADQLTGICGDCNGQRDDFLTKSGEDVSMKEDKFSLIGGSYQVPDDSDTPETKCDVNDIQISCSHSQTKPCNLIRHRLFKICNQIMGDDLINEYIEACRIDVCSYLKNNHNELNEVRCRILEGFLSECENVGEFVNWRPLARCAKKCAVNQFYKHKTLTCQPSCSNRSPNCSTYTEGCVCKPGFILSGGDCVPESECGCYSKNIYMKVYEEIYSDDCRTKSLCHVNGEIEQVKLNGCPSGSQCKVQAYKHICICKDGFSYSNNTCRPIALKPCICKASGDPHYRTFDGQMIHFMGTCKYILATIKNGSNNTYFSVEIKNEHRGNNDVSYTRLVDVKLTGVTIRLLPANKILVNSEERTLPIENYKSFTATYSVGWITVITNWGLKVMFDGRHQVTVTLPPTFADQLTGICGDCNGQRDDFLTKSGEDVSMKEDKFSLIGGSYQVPDDSDTPETKCDVKDIQIGCSRSQTQTCNLIRHRLFKICNEIMGDDSINEYIEACRIDVCSYLKINHNELNEVRCRILEGFVSECENVGVLVNWRPLARCAKKCAVNQFYKHNTLTCQPSCSNRSPNCSTYTEGCVCKPGFILSGGDCVAESDCGCYSKNIYMKVYEEIYSDDCRTKSLCHVNGEIEQVKLNGCPSGSQCKVQAYKRICICKDGFSYSNNICRPIVCNKPIDLIFMIDDSESIGEKNFLKIKLFVKNLMQSFNIQLDSIRIGLVTTSTVVRNHIFLKDSGNLETIMESLLNITYSKGKSLFHVGLKYIRSKAFSRNFGSRIKTPRIVIAIIGSKSKLPAYTFREALQLKQSGINVFVLGIGNNVSIAELKTISSRPDSDGIFTVDSYDSLNPIKTALVTSMCSVNPCQNSPCKNGGICINKAFGYTCQCTANFFGRFCEQVRKCTCIVYGDPHYKTFDGEMIHYMGGCKYTLVTTKHGLNNTSFSVEVKNEHRGNNHVTYTRSLEIKLKNVTISLLSVNRILVNSEERSLPIMNYKDFSVSFAVGWVVFTTKWGLIVKFDGTHRITVSLPLTFSNKLTGICGDCNGIKDDLRTKSGRNVSSQPDKYSLIGDSYLITDDSDKLEHSCKATSVNTSCQTKETKRCDAIINGNTFQTCVQTLGYTQTKQFIDSCRIDVCSYKNDEDNMKNVFCQILEGFASQCENAGIVVDWRKEARCPKFCASFQEYKYNTPTCQPTCLNMKPHCLTRTEGCICQPGYVLSGNECVSRLRCGCRNANLYMTLKEDMYTIDCKTKYICLRRNQLRKLRAPCQENSLCRLENNKRVCVCDNGYIMSEGKCIKQGTMEFIRVTNAYIKGMPILAYVSYDIQQCSLKCLEIDKCKSFNYDTKSHICELFNINAASDNILTSRGCSHKNYYQRVLSTNVLINGASIIDCHSLEENEGITTIELCQAKCLHKKCAAFDYSNVKGTCRIMLSVRTEFQLKGDEKKTFLALTYLE